MSFKAEDLRVGDVVSKPDGYWGKPWSHEVKHFSENLVYTKFKDGVPDWMSLANMQTCLDQEGTVVHRDGKQIYPVSENAHEPADVSANSNREEANK